MTRSWRILAGLLALVFVVYFVGVAVSSLDLAALTQALSTPVVLLALLLSACLYACIIPITGWAWSLLLAARAETWRPLQLSAILGLAQLAKYVPGNIAQHAARAALAMRRGMKSVSLVATIGQETVLAVGASVCVGAVALLASGRVVSLAAIEGSKQGWVMLVLATAMILMLPFARRLLHLLPANWINLISGLTKLPSSRTAICAFLAYSLNYLLIGAGLSMLAASLELASGLSYPVVTAAFALSWLLGFVMPGAPAGLGAREGIMLMLLQGTAPPGDLVTFVLLARVATMLGDIICFLGAGFMLLSFGGGDRKQ